MAGTIESGERNRVFLVVLFVRGGRRGGWVNGRARATATATVGQASITQTAAHHQRLATVGNNRGSGYSGGATAVESAVIIPRILIGSSNNGSIRRRRGRGSVGRGGQGGGMHVNVLRGDVVGENNIGRPTINIDPFAEGSGTLLWFLGPLSLQIRKQGSFTRLF